jgi:predicted nucleic acid-binding protein
VYIKALDKCVIVVRGVIANKVVELQCNFKAFKDLEDNSYLHSAYIIAVEVVKHKEYIALLILSVYSY